MKLSTSKTELQTALQKLSKAIPTRSTIPILSSVLFEVNKDGVVLRTTDLEITIITNLPASIETEGTSALPLQTLLNITNELPDKTRIEISSDQDNKVKISTILDNKGSVVHSISPENTLKQMADEMLAKKIGSLLVTNK